MNSPFPQNYEEWRDCITKKCGIPLTDKYISKRLAIWQNDKLEETKTFRRLYGDEHWQAVIKWFEQAKRDI